MARNGLFTLMQLERGQLVRAVEESELAGGPPAPRGIICSGEPAFEIDGSFFATEFLAAISVTDNLFFISASTAAPMMIWARSQWRPICSITRLTSAIVKSFPPMRLTRTASASARSRPSSSSGWARSFSTTSRERAGPPASTNANALSECRSRTSAHRSSK